MDSKNHAQEAVKSISPAINGMMKNVTMLMGALNKLQQDPSITKEQKKHTNKAVKDAQGKMSEVMKQHKDLLKKVGG